MLKNKIIAKKIRNIFMLLMAIIIMVGVYTNIRNSRAENVIQIDIEVADKSNLLKPQTITVDATETKEGNYLLELPVVLNKNIVTKYYTNDGTEVSMNDETSDKTLRLTDEEVANKKIQLQTDYDTKEVQINNETKLFYNKELKNESEDVIVTGYMPLESEFETKHIDLNTLKNEKKSNDEQTLRKAFETSIQETVKDETNDETNDETKKVAYDPSEYNERIALFVKYKQENEKTLIYKIDDNKTEGERLELVPNSETDEGIVVETDKTEKYVIATEKLSTTEITNDNQQQENSNNETNNTETTTNQNDEESITTTEQHITGNDIKGSEWQITNTKTVMTERKSTMTIVGPEDVLTEDLIKVIANGNDVSDSVTKKITDKQQIDGKTEYTVEITELPEDTTTIKIQLKKPTNTKTGSLTPGKIQHVAMPENFTTNNNIKIAEETSYDNDIMLTATTTVTLKSALTAGDVKEETSGGGWYGSTTTYTVTATSTFLGNSALQRGKIESVTFLTSQAQANSTKWDVSSSGDGSIMAWYTGSGPYKVYIASNGPMISLPTNSIGFFAYIGYDASCTATSVINNMDVVTSSGVTDMRYMFYYTGYQKMTELDLGDNFDTSSVNYSTSGWGSAQVSHMNNMFEYCGHNAMTTLHLGKSFKKIMGTYSRGWGGGINNAPSNFLSNTGKSGACTIYCPTDIYSGSTAMKVTTSGGSTTVSYNKVVAYETTPPTLNVKNTVNNATYNGAWTGQTVKSVMTFSDTGSGINPSTLAWSTDGVTWTSFNNTSTSTFTKNWDSSINATIYIRVKDYSRNEAKTSFQLKIDRTAPTTPVVTNSSNGNWTTSNVTISAYSEDADSKINRIEYSTDGQRTWKSDWSSSTSGNRVTATNQFSTEQDTTIAIRAIDNAGNTSSVVTTNVRIDRSNPTWNERVSKSATTTSSGYTYKVTLTGEDSFALNTNASILNSSNTTVILEDYAGTRTLEVNSGYRFLTTSSTSTTKSFPIEVYNISEFGGKLTIKIKAGALVDLAGKTSSAKDYVITIDLNAPTWEANYSNGVYNKNAHTYSIIVKGGDEVGLKTSSISTANVSVTVGGSAGSVSITQQSLSDDKKSIAVQLTINNYTTEKEIVVTMKENSLIDTDDNGCSEQKYIFTPDITPPEWSYTGGGKNGFNPNTSEYRFNLVAKDARELKSSATILTLKTASITSGNVQIKNASTNAILETNKVSIGDGVLSEDGKTKTFPITIKSYKGEPLRITIDAGAAKDNGNPENESIAKTISLEGIDIEIPQWTIESAQKIGTTATMYLVGTDNERISASNLVSIDQLTITINNTKVTSGITLGSVEDYGDGKNGKKYKITINNYTGGVVKINVPAKTLMDSSNYYNTETNLEVGEIPIANDTDIPIIKKESGSENSSTRTVTVVFTVTDSNFDFSQSITADEITVKSSWTGWGQSQDLNATIVSEETIENGKRYTVTVGGLSGYSGSIQMTIAAGAVKDLVGKPNEQTTIQSGQFNWSFGKTDAQFIKKGVTINKNKKEMYIDIVANKQNTSWMNFWASFTFTTSTVIDLSIDGTTIFANGVNKVNNKMTLTVTQMDYNYGSSNSGGTGGNWFNWWQRMGRKQWKCEKCII